MQSSYQSLLGGVRQGGFSGKGETTLRCAETCLTCLGKKSRKSKNL